MSDGRTKTDVKYEEPKVHDYGDLAEITAARSFSPNAFDGDYAHGTQPPPTGVFTRP
jgi:hypothetical protein